MWFSRDIDDMKLISV
jgi:alpha-1,3-mannosyltransferase